MSLEELGIVGWSRGRDTYFGWVFGQSESQYRLRFIRPTSLTAAQLEIATSLDELEIIGVPRRVLNEFERIVDVTDTCGIDFVLWLQDGGLSTQELNKGMFPDSKPSTGSQISCGWWG